MKLLVESMNPSSSEPFVVSDRVSNSFPMAGRLLALSIWSDHI